MQTELCCHHGHLSLKQNEAQNKGNISKITQLTISPNYSKKKKAQRLKPQHQPNNQAGISTLTEFVASKIIPCWIHNMNIWLRAWSQNGKNPLTASHRHFYDSEIHFRCHLHRVLAVLKFHMNFSPQEELDKNSYPTDSPQCNFFLHKILLKRPQTGVTAWSF